MEGKQEYEPRKLFVGGLPRWNATPDKMRRHFAKYGHVVEALVMVYPDGMGRGFGFVEFQDEEGALRALDVRERDAHNSWFGRRVDVKRAEKKGTKSTQTQSCTYNLNADSRKIFVGGLHDKITEDDLSGYFQKFGTIIDVVVMYEKETKKPRGFGFVTFDSQEATYKVLENSFHYVKGTKVETKYAEPREQNGRYHGSMTRCAMSQWSPSNSYGGMYSQDNMPLVLYNGQYLVPCLYPNYLVPCLYPNYGYMTQTGISNDTSMMVMQAPPTMYAHYGRPYYGYGALSVKLENDSKFKGNHQSIDISASASMKADPVKPDSK